MAVFFWWFGEGLWLGCFHSCHWTFVEVALLFLLGPLRPSAHVDDGRNSKIFIL